jgi:hypothetical protein
MGFRDNEEGSLTIVIIPQRINTFRNNLENNIYSPISYLDGYYDSDAYEAYRVS